MAAPKTVKTYPLNGSSRDFEIPFEYLARKFVIVTLIGQDRKELILNTDYRFTQRTIITTTRPWGPADNYQFIEIKRVTSATERLVDFSDGSILRASDLNTSSVQALHIAEEGRDIATDTIGVDNNGQLDARGRQIKNLADGVDDGDAITMRQVRAYDNSSLNNANRSEASRIASEQARDASIQARTGSEAARTGSEAARDLAQRWASNPVNAVVAGGMYSALHYAAKSAESQDISFQAMVRSESARDRSESARDRSETAATTATSQANRATTEADRAKTEADTLGNANLFMGTLSKVESFIPYWKEAGSFKKDLYLQREGTAETAYTDNVRITHGAAGNVALRDDVRGVTRWVSYASGLFEAVGLRSLSGSSYVNANALAGNSHYWFNDPDGTARSVIYSGQDGAIRVQPAYARPGSQGPVVFQTNGDFTVPRNITMNGGYFESDGNLVAAWLRGGSLRTAFDSLKSGTRIRNVPVVIWERGVDTVGGTGDQGAPGSKIYLREALLGGDFYMFELYGGGKFYSTTNCVFTTDSTENHDVPFDSGGAVVWRYDANGDKRLLNVVGSQPSNQYGIRRVFLFKLQLA